MDNFSSKYSRGTYTLSHLNTLYLEGRLRCPPDAGPLNGVNLYTENDLPIDVNFRSIMEDGSFGNTSLGGASGYTGVYPILEGGYKADQPYAVFDAHTNTFIGAVTPVYVGDSNYALKISPATMIPPNGIGAPPQSNGSYIVPTNSPMVLVGVANIDPSTIMLRQQFWAISPESYTLLPDVDQKETITITTGVKSDASSFDDLAASIGASTSASFFGFSMSVSASMSYQGGTQQTVTYSKFNTFKKELSYDPGDINEPKSVLIWQLQERLTVLSKDSKGKWAIAAISETTLAPALPQVANLPHIGELHQGELDVADNKQMQISVGLTNASESIREK